MVGDEDPPNPEHDVLTDPQKAKALFRKSQAAVKVLEMDKKDRSVKPAGGWEAIERDLKSAAELQSAGKGEGEGEGGGDPEILRLRKLVREKILAEKEEAKKKLKGFLGTEKGAKALDAGERDVGVVVWDAEYDGPPLVHSSPSLSSVGPGGSSGLRLGLLYWRGSLRIVVLDHSNSFFLPTPAPNIKNSQQPRTDLRPARRQPLRPPPATGGVHLRRRPRQNAGRRVLRRRSGATTCAKGRGSGEIRASEGENAGQVRGQRRHAREIAGRTGRGGRTRTGGATVEEKDTNLQTVDCTVEENVSWKQIYRDCITVEENVSWKQIYRDCIPVEENVSWTVHVVVNVGKVDFNPLSQNNAPKNPDVAGKESGS